VRVGTKLAAFGVVLVAAFGGGAAIGALTGPIDVDGGRQVHDVPDAGPREATPVAPETHKGH